MVLSIRSALPSLRSGLSNIQYAKLRLPSFHTVAPPLYQTPPSPPWLYPPHDLCVRQCPVHGCAQVRHKVQHRRHQVQRQRVLDVQQPAVKAVVQRQADQLVCSLRGRHGGRGTGEYLHERGGALGKPLWGRIRQERQRVAGGGPSRMAGRRGLLRAASRRSMRRQGGHHCCTVQSDVQLPAWSTALTFCAVAEELRSCSQHVRPGCHSVMKVPRTYSTHQRQ